MAASRRPSWPARFPRPTLRGGAFLGGGAALFVAAVGDNRRDLLFIACLLLVVPLVAFGYLMTRPVRLQLTRAFRPAHVPAGGESVSVLVVRNRSSRPLVGARWRETGPAGYAPMPRDRPLPDLAGSTGDPGGPGGDPASAAVPAADGARLECVLAPHRRGRYPYGPLLVGKADPFGLFVALWPVGGVDELVVTPRVTELPGRGLTGIQGGGDALERQRHLNQNSDELIAREYRPGDSLRRVNWPATARHGEIMVRQEEHRSDSGVRLVLDTALPVRDGSVRDGSGRDGDRMRREAAFELAVEVAASVGVHLLGAGFRVDVLFRAPDAADPEVSPNDGIGIGLFDGLDGLARPGGPGTPDSTVSYTGNGGVVQFLDELAGLEQRPDVPGAPGGGDPRAVAARSPGGYLPTFAVLPDGGDRHLARLTALAAQGRPAIAFLIEPMRPAAVARLRDAGWRCVGVANAAGIGPAWQEALEGRGAVRESA